MSKRCRPSPSDPAQQEGDKKRSHRPARPSKWIESFLYAFFWVILLLPTIRRRRRRPDWWRVRLLAAGLGLAVATLGMTFSKLWLVIPGSVLVLLALLVRGVRDPEHERKLQARYKSDYLLNGGKLTSGRFPRVPTGQPLYILLKDQELLFVPADGVEVAGVLAVSEIEDIRVHGKPYVPVYVSEAKDPPVRETHVDQTATAPMELFLKDGRVLRFEYTGAFHTHLAETAAHAIYSVKRLGGPDGVGGQTPEVFHVIGR
ncbi:MAG: hypothetical protein OXL36_05830 [Bryobacterales bacterium]|nr:hypothetical protein [Bryobacterales bacterium]MDE0292733.1 hypothetical protein [Bryobacterales bacterium]